MVGLQQMDFCVARMHEKLLHHEIISEDLKGRKHFSKTIPLCLTLICYVFASVARSISFWINDSFLMEYYLEQQILGLPSKHCK